MLIFDAYKQVIKAEKRQSNEKLTSIMTIAY